MITLKSIQCAVVFITVFMVCCAQRAESKSDVILPGYLDLQLIEGSRIDENCTYLFNAHKDELEEWFVDQCVIVGHDDAEDMADRYVQSLVDKGWRVGEVIANGIWAVDRIRCLHVGIWLYPLHEPESDDLDEFEEVVIWFIVARLSDVFDVAGLSRLLPDVLPPGECESNSQ